MLHQAGTQFAATTDRLTESSCCLLGLSHILLRAVQKTAADSVDCLDARSWGPRTARTASRRMVRLLLHVEGQGSCNSLRHHAPPITADAACYLSRQGPHSTLPLLTPHARRSSRCRHFTDLLLPPLFLHPAASQMQLPSLLFLLAAFVA